MILRVSKTLLVLAVALYYSIVVFNNITDYDSNFQFVRHVLMMDSTFPNNSAMWHASIRHQCIRSSISRSSRGKRSQ